MNEFPGFRHLWLVFIGFTILNALILQHRSRKYIQAQPHLEAGYQKLFKGILLWGNLPWVVMGIGIVLGGVPGPFSYFDPRHGNPFVLAWFATVIALWILGFRWLFALRGAEFLVEHPGLLRGLPNPTTIRVFYSVMVAVGAVTIFGMFTAKL